MEQPYFTGRQGLFHYPEGAILDHAVAQADLVAQDGVGIVGLVIEGVDQLPAGGAAQLGGVEVEGADGGLGGAEAVCVGEGGHLGIAGDGQAVLLQDGHGPDADVLVHTQEAADPLGQQVLDGLAAVLQIVDAHADGGLLHGDAQLLAGVAEAGQAALVDDVAQVVAKQCGAARIASQDRLGEGAAAADLVVIRFHDGLALVLQGQGAEGGERDAPADQQIHDGVLLNGPGQDDAVDLAVVQGADQRDGIGLVLQADHHVVAHGEGLVHDGAHGLADEGDVQLDEVSGQGQGEVVGAALRQTLRGGVGFVIVLFDIGLHPFAGGGGDTALAGDGAGDRGLGHAQLAGDVVNG